MSKRKKTLLVVDDEPGIRELLKHIFETDYQIYTAENGLEAINILKERLVDLIILDMVMPVQSGLKTILEIKRYFPELGMIVMTGHAEGLASAKAQNIDHVFSKPFKIPDMKIAVDALLSRPA